MVSHPEPPDFDRALHICHVCDRRPNEGDCLICGRPVCEEDGRWAEGRGWCCAGCVIKVEVDDDVTFFTRADFAALKTALEAA